jgi:hypothetical protein
MPAIAHSFLEEVMREIRSGIASASALPVEDAPLNAVIKEIREHVEFQLPGRDEELDRQKWDDQGRNVMIAANAVGVIATCIARVQRKHKVDKDALEKAFSIVRQECKGVTAPQGCYCDKC